MNGEKKKSYNRITDVTEILGVGKMVYQGIGRSILKICIIWIQKNMLQSICNQYRPFVD